MPKKVLFVVDNLVMGGLTKVLENLLKNLDLDKYDVDLLVLHYYKDMKIEINPKINILNGNKYFSYIDDSLKKIIKRKDIKAFWNKLKLALKIKTGLIKSVIEKSRKDILVKEYDVEVAFSDGFSHIFVANGNTKNKIAWMHTDISIQNDSKRYYKLIKESLEKMMHCVSVSEKVGQAYKEIYGLDEVITINNIIDDDNIKKAAEESCDSFKKEKINLISVGRVESAKNYRRFINIHKRLIDDGYEINSFVIGDGLERQELENLVKEYRIEDSFKFLGRKDNPFPYVKNADIFILSSDYEGLPTVLYESIILGTPCVSTNVAGANEILQNKYGIVVDVSDDALYGGVKKILDDHEFLDQIRKNISNYKFNKEKIMEKIESIL